MSPKKYFAKDLELCEARNLSFSTASSVMKLQKLKNPPNCSFLSLGAVLNNKFFGSQCFKFIAKYFFELTEVKATKKYWS